MPTSVKSRQTTSEPPAKALRKGISLWTFFLLITNVLLLAAVVVLWWRQPEQTAASELIEPYSQPETQTTSSQTSIQPVKRHQFSYKKWLEILKQEADVAATKQPSQLSIILGDSLSLWFPTDLLPSGSSWLNQGISGETSGGLLNRLDLFARTQPKKIWVMIGINDLIREKSDREISKNYQKIITNLRQTHPQTEIIVQSILPHADESATWEGRDRLIRIPNSRIRQLNTQIKDFAVKNKARYLDLYPLFSDSQGNLKPEFSTDGLHLNREGYLIWRSAIILSNQSNQ